MKTYTFRGVKYDEGTRVVKAMNEADARHKAMEVRWGPATGIYAPIYAGAGLTLVEVTDD